LEHYSQKVEQLAAGRERQRLARELHDSVTQTIFSMTLTTQSALLLLDRDRQQVAAQLDRLDQLAQGALSEMQLLISELAPEARAGGGFLATLQQHLADRQRLDDLSVRLEVEGSQLLNPAEEASLFRIAQEALNNIIKHGQTSEAVLRLHLGDPFSMEIEDRGAGFDPQQAGGSGRVGLAGMRERAIEIGWALEIESTPGYGTRVRVQKGARET
jgi:signal transduction histidine kinase